MLALVTGCSDSPGGADARDLLAGRDAAPVDARDLGVDAQPPDVPAADRGDSGPLTFDESSLSFCLEERTTFEAEACCPAASLRDMPATAASVLDLSGYGPSHPDTCAALLEDGFSFEFGVVLSPDPADYPMKVILPEVRGVDPACAEACGTAAVGSPSATAFGIGFRTYIPGVSGPLMDDGLILAVSVPAPWKLVSGGCGEACAWTCLEGYQEYDVPRSCTTLGYGDFGLVTADPAAPSVEVLLELVDSAGAPASYAPYACCLYSR